MLNIIINRLDAANAGMNRFNTGKPCRRGHIADRFVANGGCTECINPIRRAAAVSQMFWAPVLLLDDHLRPEHVEEAKRLLDGWLRIKMREWGYKV